MQVTISLRSGAEIERLHSAAYSFAETRADGLRPAVRIADARFGLLAHVLTPDEASALAFQRFWSGYRGPGLRLAA